MEKWRIPPGPLHHVGRFRIGLFGYQLKPLVLCPLMPVPKGGPLLFSDVGSGQLIAVRFPSSLQDGHRSRPYVLARLALQNVVHRRGHGLIQSVEPDVLEKSCGVERFESCLVPSLTQ